MANLLTPLLQFLLSGLDLALLYLRRCLFQILASAPLPHHVSFILDGNRRYARKYDLPPGDAHQTGFRNLVRILRYCAELGLPCVSIFAFSIDNFRRTPHEIATLMSLFREKLLALGDDIALLNDAGIRIHFIGDISLLDQDIRDLVLHLAEETKGNDRLDLLLCIAYSTRYEMVRGARGACEEVTVADVEREMYLTGYPEPDLLVRTSGEWRMSNFVQWQSGGCMLHSPGCLWPELSLRHLVSAVVRFQRGRDYLRDARSKIWFYDRCDFKRS
ncbi:Dehydrodolichyl diphosphate synthase 6 [Platanthera zijinensis]|uniref:Alkyl transferase n=1 Tax=Platanthera zijinensis TaxID=2320716 RepID=A0AAP0AW29_9ASPA